MPELLVDIDALDLTQDVFSVEDMQKILSQRGRFSLIDAVCSFDESTDFIVAYKDIKNDDWWNADHIPGRAIFPGVLMVEAAAQLGTFDFFVRRPDFHPQFVGFTGIDRIRYRAIVEPECRLYFIAKIKRVRNMMFTYACQGIVDGKVVFDGALSGTAM